METVEMFPHTDGIVEMFPHTGDIHNGVLGYVEVAVLLERVSNRKADSHVKLNVKMEDYYRIKDSEENKRL